MLNFYFINDSRPPIYIYGSQCAWLTTYAYSLRCWSYYRLDSKRKQTLPENGKGRKKIIEFKKNRWHGQNNYQNLSIESVGH